ncbi:MAG TPA: M48 family metallopeptidase [Steroidobacteraceae bacterium]|nr:M48 family metallopeptidase [Steroidobacteraceae bacterium]
MRSAALLLIVALCAGCATSPTGRSQLMLVSPEQAVVASRQAYLTQIGELEKKGKLASDRQLLEWVEDVTSRLVAQAVIMRPDTKAWEWSVAVIDDPEVVNAWCMAGGRMAIYTGLIRKIDPTEDELAQVMAHEIAHALANHTAEKMSIAMASQAGILAAAVISDRPGAAVAGAALAAQLAVELPNSRTAETEADRIGIELAARAGFDPNAAVTLWQKMGRVGGKSPPQFLSTHPAPQTREQTLRELAPKLTPVYRSATNPPRHPVRIVS